MEFAELVKKARSVRSFDESARVSEDELLKITDTARCIPSACNFQPLKYRISADKEEVELLLSNVRIGGAVAEKLPPEDHHPTAFITICHDLSITPENAMSDINVGIAAQTLNLAAQETGISSCMIGAFSREKIKELLSLPENLTPVLMMMFGRPAEFPEIVPLRGEKGKETTYYRNEKGHFVPKRALCDIYIKK